MVDSRKKALAILSASLLAMVPWMQISKAVADRVAVQPGALIAAVAAGVGIHLLFLGFNISAVKLLRLGGSDSYSGKPFLTIDQAQTSKVSGAPYLREPAMAADQV